MAILAGCSGPGFEKGTYGYDVAFFKDLGIATVELSSADGQSRVLMVPGWQGRVMTSTTGGGKGSSYGWINYDYIASGEVSPQFNSYGGEERFWIGPEGGPNSFYFAPGVEQVYANWVVPKVIDTEAFAVEAQSADSVLFTRRALLTNASGRSFDIGIRRLVRLEDASEVLGVKVPGGVRALAYSTSNSLKNEGDGPWTRETGLPSVWLLGTLNPTPSTTVFIPYLPGPEPAEDSGRLVVKDDYFGKVPSDRLVVKDGFVYFRIDGAYRAKIGLPQGVAGDLCGSYDSANHVLNILKYTVPEGPCDYVNGQWGHQDNPYGGDVINSYNDGPTETGTIMGPFYEIETSSPGAALAPGCTLTHKQYTIHLEGPEDALSEIAEAVFGVSLKTVSAVFAAGPASAASSASASGIAQASAAASSASASFPEVYDDAADPVAQIREAVASAAASGRFVICQVGGNWCPWCLRFADFITKDEEIATLVRENFVYAHINQRRVNPDSCKKEVCTEALRMLGNPGRFGYPVMVVLDGNGKVIHTQDSSLLEEGEGYDRGKVISFFSKWTPAAVKSAE